MWNSKFNYVWNGQGRLQRKDGLSGAWRMQKLRPTVTVTVFPSEEKRGHLSTWERKEFAKLQLHFRWDLSFSRDRWAAISGTVRIPDCIFWREKRHMRVKWPRQHVLRIDVLKHMGKEKQTLLHILNCYIAGLTNVLEMGMTRPTIYWKAVKVIKKRPLILVNRENTP